MHGRERHGSSEQQSGTAFKQEKRCRIFGGAFALKKKRENERFVNQ